MNCPNCGAGLKIQSNKAVCEYCGYEEPLPGVQSSGNDDFFNMVVFNESYGGEEITLSIPECNIGFIIRAGEAVAKDIPSGYHTIVVSAGGKTEYRSVFIPNDGTATKVYISIAVLGISIRVVEPGGVNRYGDASGYSSRRLPPDRVLPVLALVFSILFPVVGLIFAFIDLAQTKSQNKKLSTMTIAAFIISSVRFAATILIFLGAILGAMH